ncbi:MAG: hypothetical protein JWR54_3419 [Mucilaginibacter sp.]|nr:hypothetical protein [Mucilaginibacter sp.]
MTIAQSHNVTAPSVDGFVNFVLGQIKSSAQESQNLLSLGAKDGLAQLVQQLVVDPFSFNINALKHNHAELLKFVDIYVLAYLKAQHNYIHKLYKHQTVTGINYFIILSEDTTENRELFFQLLDHYETLKINAILPLNLSFLPIEVADRMTLGEIALS